jgi:hypothetical protein
MKIKSIGKGVLWCALVLTIFILSFSGGMFVQATHVMNNYLLLPIDQWDCAVSIQGPKYELPFCVRYQHNGFHFERIVPRYREHNNKQGTSVHARQ